MKIFNCAQLSDEWWELHRGKVSASMADRILTPKTCKPSTQQEDVICELIAQKFSHEKMNPGDQYASPAMMMGVVNEPEARNWYSMQADSEVVEVGTVMTDDERFLASPDGIILPSGDAAETIEIEGCLELKCPLLKTQAKYLLANELPNEYRGQVHMQLLVTGAKWVDFASYCPGLPGFVIRVVPDKFTDLLRAELDRFWERYQSALAKMGWKAPAGDACED